jgi:hypothetical protein
MVGAMTKTTKPRSQLADLLREEACGDVYAKHDMDPDLWVYVGIGRDGRGGYGARFVSREVLAQKGPRHV